MTPTPQQIRQSIKDSANPFPAYRYRRSVPDGAMRHLIAINAAQLAGYVHLAATLMEVYRREYPEKSTEGTKWISQN